MLICTIATANYLPQAVCLAKSVRETHPECRTVLCLVERDRSAVGDLNQCFSSMVLASELGLQNFDSLMFRYGPLEACMALKPQVLLWAMREFPGEKDFVYLDSDIYVYGRFEELELLLPRVEIVLTPHHVHPAESFESLRENTFRTLLTGIFNTGFIAIHRSSTAAFFLEWWGRKLRHFCYKDQSRGLYFEQRWLDLAISFFDLTIFREPGYNVANWNIAERPMSRSKNSGSYLVCGRPIRFFHFSMVEYGRDVYYFRKYAPRDSPVFEMRQRYRDDISALDMGTYSKLLWSYNQFASGEKIAQEVRHAYRELANLAAMFPHPFSGSNAAFTLAEAGIGRI